MDTLLSFNRYDAVTHLNLESDLSEVTGPTSGFYHRDANICSHGHSGVRRNLS